MSSNLLKFPVVKNAKSQNKNDKKEMFKRAKRALFATDNDTVVGRETEFQVINEFLQRQLKEKIGGSLYISGAPGTGKTAVVSHLKEKLKSKRECLSVYINCMTMTRAQDIFKKMLELLKCPEAASSTAAKASRKLREVLLVDSKKPVVVILDELDQLVSKNQEVLYKLFEWPHLPNSRLILVGISNSLDLTDRVLPRIEANTKYKPETLHFHPYTKEQIKAVIDHRLSKMNVEGVVLDPSAVEFCAQKVSANTGDIRKALSICTRAVELAEKEALLEKKTVPDSLLNSPRKVESTSALKKITAALILKVISEIDGSGLKSQAENTSTLTLHQMLAISAIIISCKQYKSKAVTFGAVHDLYKKMCRDEKIEAVSNLLNVCELIASRGLLTMKKSKKADSRQTLINFVVDENDIRHELCGNAVVKDILEKH